MGHDDVGNRLAERGDDAVGQAGYRSTPAGVTVGRLLVHREGGSLIETAAWATMRKRSGGGL